MNSSFIIDKFRVWRSRAQSIALVTVFETVGSTYSKAGHRILIAEGGDYQGLVSGGCLEGDLAEHAAMAIESGAARVVTYDLRDDADELFGLGIGCNGMLRMLVQPMTSGAGYAPFAAISEAMLGRESAAVAIVIEAGNSNVPLGATLVRTATLAVPHALPQRLVADLGALCDDVIASGVSRIVKCQDGARALVAPLGRVPKILVLGAGMDAVPLVSMASQLGWRVHVADHRSAYLERPAFSVADSLALVTPGSVRSTLNTDDFDAIVVMSHHLATDEAYLRELVAVRCAYIGVLGPPARRRNLLNAIGSAGTQFEQRLRGPVGLDLGADSPETIALSILAEVQLTLSRR